MGYSKEIKLPTKFEIRSDIIKNLYSLKNNCSSKNLNKVINQFRKVSDEKLLLSTLIKELNGQDKNFDNIIKIIIIDVFRENCKDELQKALLDEKNSDSKRIFIIDILRELDVKISYNELENYIENPKKLLMDETQFFLENVIQSPSKQIDLLDFLYGSNSDDSSLFLQYIIENYANDELSNILSLASFVINDCDMLKNIIKELGKTKSYYAFEAINYIQLKNSNQEILDLIAKTKNKLSLRGLNEEQTKKEISKISQLNTSFYEAKVSLFDSRGDFILVYSKINKSKNINVFFTAFNLLQGIMACFGFENIGLDDYKKTLDKIFNKNMSIDISPDIAKALIDDAIESGDNNTPYEILSWRRLTYDIQEKTQNTLLNFPKEFDDYKLNKTDYNFFLKKDYLRTWFVEENENPYFKNLLFEIKEIEKINQENINKLIENHIEKIFEYKICFRTTLLMQAYFLYLAKKENDAKIFYTIVYDNKYYKDFCIKILHKSIYEYFLRNNNKKYLTNDFLGIIEKWQREF